MKASILCQEPLYLLCLYPDFYEKHLHNTQKIKENSEYHENPIFGLPFCNEEQRYGHLESFPKKNCLIRKAIKNIKNS